MHLTQKFLSFALKLKNMGASWFSYAFFLDTGKSFTTPKISPRTWTKFINISWKLGGTPSAWKFLHQINQGFTFLFAQQVLQELVAVAPTVGDRPGYFMHSTVSYASAYSVNFPNPFFWKQKKMALACFTQRDITPPKPGATVANSAKVRTVGSNALFLLVKRNRKQLDVH